MPGGLTKRSARGGSSATLGCRGILGIEDLADDGNSVSRDASPPDGSVLEDGGASADGAPEGGAQEATPQGANDAGPDRTAESGTDGSPPMSTIDASPDAAHDAGLDAPGDAGFDGSVEAEAGPAPSAKLTTSQPTLDFGTVTQRQSVASGQVQIINAGKAATGILTANITGSAFSVAVDNCAGESLGPTLSCTISIALEPSSARAPSPSPSRP